MKAVHLVFYLSDFDQRWKDSSISGAGPPNQSLVHALGLTGILISETWAIADAAYD